MGAADHGLDVPSSEGSERHEPLMGEEPVDVEKLLARSRDDRLTLRWLPLAPDQRTELSNEPATETARLLECLRGQWELPDRPAGGSRVWSLKGAIHRIVGRLTFAVLAPYLREERAMLATVVQVNDSLNRRCDHLQAELVCLRTQVEDRQIAEASHLAQLTSWLHSTPIGQGEGASGP